MSQLHLVHALVGDFQQGVRILAIDGVHADTETRPDGQQPILDLHGRRDCLRYGVGHLHDLAAIAHCRQDDDKLVAADPGDGIGAADTGDDLVRDVLQHDIARCVPAGVVDFFERIEVEIDDGQRAGWAGAADESPQALVQRGPIQQVRQRIVLCSE